MTSSELVLRARELCLRIGRTFPGELGAYACAWQREGYDLSWCWGLAKAALRQGQALWLVDAAVRRQYAAVRAARDAMQRSLCEPVLRPASSTARERAFQGSSQASALHSDFGTEDDAIEDDDFWPAPHPEAQPTSPPRLAPVAAALHKHPRINGPASGALLAKAGMRPNTKANQVRELLKTHVVRRGPISVLKLESIARSEGLLRLDQPISRSSTFCRIARELNIESKRCGFGRDGRYQWRLRPPEWTRSQQGREGTDGCP